MDYLELGAGVNGSALERGVRATSYLPASFEQETAETPPEPPGEHVDAEDGEDADPAAQASTPHL
jgi:hypothetical protein